MKDKTSANDSHEPSETTSKTEGPSVSSESPRESNQLDVAVLYKNIDISDGCGHTTFWKADKLIDLQHCQICLEPVSMISDGLVSHNDGDDDDDNQVIRFKFGKQIYQLSTANKEEQPQKDSRRWWFWPSFSIERKINYSSTANKRSTTILAQNRIANALNLANLKILHKGKIIYPPPDCSTDVKKKNCNDGTEEEPTREVIISRRILEISNENWKNNMTKKKVSLVVMGTLIERQLKRRTENDSNSDNVCSILQRLQRSLWFSLTILQYSMQVTWLLCRSFLGPFLPSYMLRDDRSNGGGENDRSTGQTRPHQD